MLSSYSPTTVLAIIRELKSKGEVTDIVVSISVVGDVIALILFAVFRSTATNACSGKAFDAPSFMIDITMIILSIVIGVAYGGLIMLMLNIKHMNHAILPLGFLLYLTCDYILAYTLAYNEYSIDIDPLLICIAGGFTASNLSSERELLISTLTNSAKFFFIPFFTAVG